MSRKAAIVSAMVWTLTITSLRAARLPNNFSIEHWLIDYRYGFVKRGLVGSLLSLAATLARSRPTEWAIDALAVAMFVVFCAVLFAIGIRMLHRARWSSDVALAVLVFLSSPFVVMSAHLVGYYDNIGLMLTALSLALLFRERVWPAALVQAVAMLVHENTLLIGVPVFCWTWWCLRERQRSEPFRPLWPVMLPIATFVLLTIGQSVAPPQLERSLTAHLSTYPFVAGTIADVRVPHWITITFYDSYLLHRGHFEERIFSQAMIALVLPSLLALLGTVIERHNWAVISPPSLVPLAICLIPQSMHVMVWDTARIWTYSIVCAFLLAWVDLELRPERERISQFGVLFVLIALLTNAIGVTPLMDGLRERFDVTTRLLCYAPVFALAIGLARRDGIVGARPRPPLLT
jgi:hypothetical protein